MTESLPAGTNPPETDAVAAAYAAKPASYFDGARQDIVDLLATSETARILEIGCGNGSTGALAKAQGKCASYVGIELDPQAAAEAREVLDRVICGNVELLEAADLGGPFDAVIVSEVLEHLHDPWRLLADMSEQVVRGGRIYASSPNIAHIHVIWGLLRGSFSYAEAGVMDRTHLRWFTPRSYRQMFEDAGFSTIAVQPVRQPSWKWRWLDRLTGGRLAHLAYVQTLYLGARD